MELEEVVERVIEFLKKAGHTYPKLFEARKVNDKWQVKADLGLYGRYTIIEIDDKTGKVISFYEEGYL